jgi:hypothetical protein
MPTHVGLTAGEHSQVTFNGSGCRFLGRKLGPSKGSAALGEGERAQKAEAAVEAFDAAESNLERPPSSTLH